MEIKQRFRFFYNLDYHYAFVQVILMVLSILIAFWVDAWWQGKQDIKKEKNYLSALQLELEENRVKYEAHLQVLNDDIETTNAFLLLLQNSQSGNIAPDSLQRYLWPLVDINIITPNRSALDDLITSGGMQYVRSNILRRQIATYRQTFEYDVEQQRSIAELWNTTLSIFNGDKINLSHVIPSGGIITAPKNANVTFPVFEFPSSFSPSERKAFANQLFQRILFITRMQKNHEKMLTNIRALLFQLDFELNPNEPTSTNFEG